MPPSPWRCRSRPNLRSRSPPAQSFDLTGNWPRDLVAAVLDLDGNLDLVITTGSQEVSVRLGDGTGDFSDDKAFRATFTGKVAAAPAWVATADFNGDPYPDLVFGYIPFTAPDSTELQVWLGDGTGD